MNIKTVYKKYALSPVCVSGPTFSKCVMPQLMCPNICSHWRLLGLILPSDSWGVDVLPDYIVSSSPLISLAPPKPGLHFHSVIPAGRQGGHTAAHSTPPICRCLGGCSNQVVVCWQFVNLPSIGVSKEGDQQRVCCVCCCCCCSGSLPLSVQGSHFVSVSLCC